MTLTREDFPAVSADRFWMVAENPKSITKPVVLTLRADLPTPLPHSTSPRGAVSRTLGTIYTTADPEDIKKAAVELFAIVGAIDDVVGIY